MLAMWSVGFVLGVGTQVSWGGIPDPRVVAALAVLLLLLPVILRMPVPASTTVARVAAGVIAGLLVAITHASLVRAAWLPASPEGADERLDVRVESVRVLGDGGQALTVSTASLPWFRPAQHALPFRWQLRLHARIPGEFRPGETWRLCVRLRPPHASWNPGAADFGRYLFGERVVASGYLREDACRRRLLPASGWQALRGVVVDAALPLLGDGPGDIAGSDDLRFARAVLPALVVDDRSLIAPSHWRVLADTGTAHLVAISGLHVALLWGAILWAGSLLGRRRLATLRFRAIVIIPALVIATAYALLAGMPLPALRAVLMLATASACLLAHAQVPAWRVLLFAVVAVSAFDPLAVHDAGFWLSYGAVALLVLLADLARRTRERAGIIARVRDDIRDGIRAQVMLSLLMAPLLLAIFGMTSLSSVAANLPAIPLVNLVALPCALAGFLLAPAWPDAAALLLHVAVDALALLWQWLAWLDGVDILSPLKSPSAGGPVLLVIALACLALVFAGTRLRVAALACLVLAWPVAARLPAGVLDVCVLDVGESLAVLARSRNHAWAYDAGAAWGDGDAGMSTVVPAARAMGITRLDLLVLSHDDPAHTGGAPSVIAALHPARVIAGDARLRGIDGVAAGRCDFRESGRVDGITVDLFPAARANTPNDRSCVLRIGTGRHAILLTGDAGGRREVDLAGRWGDQLASDVLVAGNHGARSASALTFLYRVAPRAVVVSSGYGNRHGHPHEDVLARIAMTGARVRQVADSGAQCFRLGEGVDAESPAVPLQPSRPWRS